MADQETRDSLITNDSYAVIDLYQNDSQAVYLVYSKTNKDSLPITTTFIGSKPCIDPTLISSDSSFYPLEIGKTFKCYHLDPHFTKVVELGTEFDIQ